jgi:hypothetical protein
MMNHCIHVVRLARRASPPAARTAGAFIVTAALVLMAACAGNPSPTGSGGSSSARGSANPSLVAFSRCMRSNGVPGYPDPDPGASNEKFPSAQQLGVTSSQLQAAENACQRLLPPGVDDQFPAAEVQLLLPGMLRFSQCMRSHGVPNWPDPSTDSQGRPVFDLSGAGFSRQEADSARLNTPTNECQHLLPTQLGGIPRASGSEGTKQ